MNTKLFIGNLAWSVNDNALGKFFEQAGEVREAIIIVDRETGRSRGFGFVTMATEEGAKKALQKLEGVHLENRPITVRHATPEGFRNGNGSPSTLDHVLDFIKVKANPGDRLKVQYGQKNFTIVREVDTANAS